MATTVSFQNMLNEYLPVSLLKEEFIKRDYLMQKVQMDEGWKGSNLVIPFQGTTASSIAFGSLTDEDDVAKHKFVRGNISTQPEVWATLQFAHKDLLTHDGKIPESTFIKILPNQIEDMMMYFKQAVSIHLLGNGGVATTKTAGNASGVVGVDRVDRFLVDQKVEIDGDFFYVTNVSVYDETVTLSDSRGGAPFDISGIGAGTVIYHPGAEDAGMTSLARQLLSPANGGDADLFGVSKTAWSYLQAIQFSGAGVNSTNILGTLFDAYTKRQRLAKSGKAPEVLVSYKHMGSILKQLESDKKAFNVVPNSQKVMSYGWTTIQIGSVSGQILTITAIQEMPDDLIYMLDWDGITFYSNGLFRRRRAPDGKEYFEVRSPSNGYMYLLDHCLFGTLVVTAPAKQLVIHSIPNY
jgi:hypothetical protein